MFEALSGGLEDRDSAVSMLLNGDDASAERRLWVAVIVQALRDATENHVIACASKPLADQIRVDARRWFERGGPDFAETCLFAGLEPDAVREAALALIAKADSSTSPFRLIDIEIQARREKRFAEVEARKQARTLAGLATQAVTTTPKPPTRKRLSPEERQRRKLDYNARRRAQRTKARRQQGEKARVLGLLPKPANALPPKPPRIVQTPEERKRRKQERERKRREAKRTAKPPRVLLTPEERAARNKESKERHRTANRDRINQQKRDHRQAMREAQHHDAKPALTPKLPRITLSPEERRARKLMRMARYRQANREAIRERERQAYAANLKESRAALRERAARRRQRLKEQQPDHAPAE